MRKIVHVQSDLSGFRKVMTRTYDGSNVESCDKTGHVAGGNGMWSLVIRLLILQRKQHVGSCSKASYFEGVNSIQSLVVRLFMLQRETSCGSLVIRLVIQEQHMVPLL